MLHEAVKDRLRGKPRGRLREVTARIRSQKEPWLAEWRPHLDQRSEAAVAVPHHPRAAAGRRRARTPSSRTTPAARATSFRRSGTRSTPLTYIGWGKSTQLGYGLGLAMGAKLAHPDKLCINFWGDAAIGMTGMDFETCVRAKIPIMSILLNNFAMATEDRRDGAVAAEVRLDGHLG